jgi:hypothetical protein
MNNRTANPNVAPRQVRTTAGESVSGSRTVDAAQQKRRRQPSGPLFVHTLETDAVIRAAHAANPKKPNHQAIANQIGATLYVVKHRAKVLGLVRQRSSWTTHELRILKRYYPTEGEYGCAKRIPRHTVSGIKNMVGRMKLRHVEGFARHGDKNGSTKIPDKYIPIIRNQHERIWPGITLKEKAGRIGISHSWLCRIINGEKRNKLAMGDVA